MMSREGGGPSVDQVVVLAKYPGAGAVMLNKGLYYVGSEGKDGGKMGAGECLSGQFRRESEAWADAARRLMEEAIGGQAGG